MSLSKADTAKAYARSTWKGVAVFMIDSVLLCVFAFLAVWPTQWYIQLIFSLATGTMIAALFVVGHDAAHGALTPYRWLNRLLGTLAFLPSMHPFSLWVKLHNLRHHRWANLATQDDVWTPMDMQSYLAMPGYKRALYRFYRSIYGPLLYYLVEFWWKKFTWPSKKHHDEVKREYVVDALIVWAFAIAYVGLLVYGSGAGWFGGEPRSWVPAVVFGAVIPFLFWNTYSGASVYLHHTHPRNVWYDNEEEWRRVSKAHTSVHVVFPRVIQIMFNSIMEHSIHHLRPGVPLYNLLEAQERLEESDRRIVVYQWSGARHSDICRRCKLFDFAAKRWTDFDGNFTSPPYREPKKQEVEEVPETVDAS